MQEPSKQEIIIEDNYLNQSDQEEENYEHENIPPFSDNYEDQQSPLSKNVTKRITSSSEEEFDTVPGQQIGEVQLEADQETHSIQDSVKDDYMSFHSYESIKELEHMEIGQNAILKEGIKKMWDGTKFQVQIKMKDTTIKRYKEDA